MGNVVYLLGAGASANAIPVVNSMAGVIQEDIVEVKNWIHQPKMRAIADNINELVEVLEELQEACTNYFSIDTYAKMLFLTRPNDFEDFKKDLCFYFTLRQIIRRPDKRYDNFWASIIRRPSRLPENVKIISWNYDFQLEQSYINMSGTDNLFSARAYLDVHYPSERRDTPSFSVMKLNGSATVYERSTGGSHYLYQGGQNSDLFTSITQLWSAFKISKTKLGYKSDLKFAWETNPNLNILSDFLNGFDTLAIIGYSFPFFNREMDQAIFEAGKFKKIYIQDPYPEEIKERLEQLSSFIGVDFSLNKYTNQFVFPKEL
jgi:hypothetical protein